MSLTYNDCLAFDALKRLALRQPVRCVELGEALWPENRYADRQAWCRPAGRALHRLKRHGLAAEVHYRERAAPNMKARSGWLPIVRGKLVVPEGIGAWEI